MAILICIVGCSGLHKTIDECWNPKSEFETNFQVEPPPPPPTEPAKEEGMETEKGSESKASEEAPQQKQAEMDVD